MPAQQGHDALVLEPRVHKLSLMACNIDESIEKFDKAGCLHILWQSSVLSRQLLNSLHVSQHSISAQSHSCLASAVYATPRIIRYAESGLIEGG